MTTPTMAEQLVPDEVWAAIQPWLPPKPPHPEGGPPWIEDRAVLGGPAVGLSAASTHERCRRTLRRRGITPRIARRGVESSTRLGRRRWEVERSLAWLLANRRLTVRYERRVDILTALLHLICARKLKPL
jgi:transposase